MQEADVPRFREFASRLAAGDFDSIQQFVAPVYYRHTPEPDEPSATDRIYQIVSDLRRGMPDLSVEFEDVSPMDDEISAVMTLRGTHQGVLWGAPGSGAVIEWTTPVKVRSIDGRFAAAFRALDFPTAVGLLRQAELVNPPDQMHLPLKHPVVMPEFLLKVALTGSAADKPCSHLDQVRVTDPETHVCAECVTLGQQWPALRMCLSCGFVGCCDTSVHKHMKQHHEQTGHPLMRSLRMDEGWMWCYEDDAFFETRTLDRLRASLG